MLTRFLAEVCPVIKGLLLMAATVESSVAFVMGVCWELAETAVLVDIG